MTERTKEFEEDMSQNKVFEKPWAIKGCSKSLTVKKKKKMLGRSVWDKEKAQMWNLHG